MEKKLLFCSTIHFFIINNTIIITIKIYLQLLISDLKIVHKLKYFLLIIYISIIIIFSSIYFVFRFSQTKNLLFISRFKIKNGLSCTRREGFFCNPRKLKFEKQKKFGRMPYFVNMKAFSVWIFSQVFWITHWLIDIEKLTVRLLLIFCQELIYFFTYVFLI